MASNAVPSFVIVFLLTVLLFTGVVFQRSLNLSIEFREDKRQVELAILSKISHLEKKINSIEDQIGQQSTRTPSQDPNSRMEASVSSLQRSMETIRSSVQDSLSGFHSTLSGASGQVSEVRTILESLVRTVESQKQFLTQRPQETQQQRQTLPTTSSVSTNGVPSVSPSELETLEPDSSILVFSYASRMAFKLCEFLQSAIYNKMNINLLGWETEGHHTGYKIKATYETLLTLPKKQIVMFVDSYDVLFSEGADRILKKFKELGKPLLFGAETGCWPFLDGRAGGEHICQNVYPQAPHKWRFINTGLWIGYAEAALELYSDLIKKDWVKIDDQELVSNSFISGNFSMALDYNCELFQNLHMSWDDMTLQNGVWTNTVTGTQPLLLHFNGGAKEAIERFERQLWFNNAAKRSERHAPASVLQAKLQVNGEAKKLEEICPLPWKIFFPDGQNVDDYRYKQN